MMLLKALTTVLYDYLLAKVVNSNINLLRIFKSSRQSDFLGNSYWITIEFG